MRSPRLLLAKAAVTADMVFRLFLVEDSRTLRQSSSVGTAFGNGGELIGRQYHHGVALEAHPFLVFPDAQLLVDAFAGHPDDVAEVPLGDGDLALLLACGIGIDEAHECLGETARQVEHDLFCLLGGLILSAISGSSRISGRKSLRSMTNSSQSVAAVASAVRGLPSRSAISPKMSPLPSTLNTASLPSTVVTLILTVPSPMAHRLVPGSPLVQFSLPIPAL
jgi:hypothetical protein